MTVRGLRSLFNIDAKYRGREFLLTIEFLSELEDKINVLLSTLERVREENSKLKQEIEQANGKISEIEAANENLKNELDQITTDSLGKSRKS